MKFIRNAKIREKVLDFLSRALLIGLSILACLWMVSGAHASQISITGIKSEPQADGSYKVEFSFSQRLSPQDVAVEFERNFIQVSLKGVSAYPARMENIKHSILEKVFTYQYQPDLARARVLLRSAASSIRDKASWEITPEGLRIVLKGGATTAESVTDSVKSKAAAADVSLTTGADEERIVEEILNESKGLKSSLKTSVVAGKSSSVEPALFSDKNDAKTLGDLSGGASGEDQAIFSGKSAQDNGKRKTEGATRVLASLLLVIGIIGASAMAYRRFSLGKGIAFQRQPKVIEVIANQGLGPKRSIALVKVLDQYMVLGMAGESISLLSNLGSDLKIEKYLDQIGGPGGSFVETFEGALSGLSGKTSSSDSVDENTVHRVAEPKVSIRGSIKKRIEGFKPL